MNRSSYPHPSSPAVTAVMRANRKKDTRPEIRIRSLLHARGHRFRKQYVIRVPGGGVAVDIAFPSRRLAVFIDGCFWHSCPQHGTVPRANVSYWSPKLERNRLRDRQVDLFLADEGWTVLRIWEHTAAEEAAEIVSARLRNQ